MKDAMVESTRQKITSLPTPAVPIVLEASVEKTPSLPPQPATPMPVAETLIEKIPTLPPPVVEASVVPPVVETPVVPAEQPKSSQVSEVSNVTDETVYYRVVATLLERQKTTGECIAVTNINCRTVKFDKMGEVRINVKKVKARPVESHINEEIVSKFHKDEQPSRPARRGEKSKKTGYDDLDDEDLPLTDKEVVESLGLLSRATNTVEYPTSTILNTLMNDYFLKQESQWVLREAYNYMDKFLFLHLGRDQSERETWLKLVLSAMRNDVDCRRP